MREYQVRICERLGGKFPGPTRQQIFEQTCVVLGGQGQIGGNATVNYRSLPRHRDRRGKRERRPRRRDG
jgi:hypothetical protein